MTLAPRLPVNQTTQMRRAAIQIVIPAKLHETFKESQRSNLITLTQFIQLVENRQAAM